MSDIIPTFKTGDRVRIMATTWAMEQGIENEKGEIQGVTVGGNCFVLLDRSRSYSEIRNIPSNQLMRIEA